MLAMSALYRFRPLRMFLAGDSVAPDIPVAMSAGVIAEAPEVVGNERV